MRPVDDSRRRPNCTLANLLPVQNVLPPLPHNKTYSKSDTRCLITKPTRRVIRCLTNKSTRKEVAAERRSVPRSGAGWQAKVFSFGFLHLVYGSS